MKKQEEIKTSRRFLRKIENNMRLVQVYELLKKGQDADKFKHHLPESELATLQMSDEEIIKEYDLILQKKSQMSKRQRDIITFMFFENKKHEKNVNKI